MKLGVMTAVFADKTLNQMLDYVKESGLDAVELCCGNYPGMPHFNVGKLLGSARKVNDLKAKVKARGLTISALSCHGNSLHPNKKIATKHHTNHRNTVKLAKKLGVKVVINFSGCPGGSDRDKFPNWVTCPWPPDFSEIIEWQWKKKLIPYWKREARFAANFGVKLAFEMHPGFAVHNTETMLRLREACGKNIGANFDPSHLFWQGMDPLVSLKALQGAIFHVHAKDCLIDPQNNALNGVLDTKSYSDIAHRSWVFRTVGYGHGEDFWRDFVSLLRTLGYDGVISIEHEDGLMSMNEGFQRAVSLLKAVMFHEPIPKMWWA